jgi:uncharacterized caspase-like protein
MRYFKFLFFLLFCNSIAAQNKKALIIGIDVYKPEGVEATNTARSSWNNLDGCVNDATAMRDLVMAKYAFPENNITTLHNENATRANIIASLNKLIDEAKKGDVIFIYYAGHGSQMFNSLSAEADKKDETIVPADAYKGVADIRDKELAAIFNKLIDKGVLLTVIMDSCHSGSVGRGYLSAPPKVRFIEENKMDAKDATIPVRPESRGALIFSAAQDFEFAKEQRDENNIPHGAFTIALLKALQQLPVDAPATNIYSSVSAIMKYYGKTQEPVLAANEQRKAGTLFGLEKGAIKNQFAIAVSKSDAKGIELQGGYAFGLSEGIRLASLSTKDTIQITEMRGANKSLAKAINNTGNKIKAGTLFEVISWASAKSPALKIYIPGAGLTDKQLFDQVKTYQSIRTTQKMNWVSDIADFFPERIYSFNEGQWNYHDGSGIPKSVGKILTPTGMEASSKNIRSAFINFPPSDVLIKDLKEAFGSYNNISIVSEPLESQYALVGTVNQEGKLAYALVKSQITVQDTTESLPSRTNYEFYDGTKTSAAALAHSLTEYAFRIAKIRDWLMLTSPAGGQSKFPFRLSFQYYTSEMEVTSDRVKINDTLSVFFQRDPSMGDWNRRKRFIYVFSIDSKGAMNLIFPDAESGNVENRFPLSNDEGGYEQRTHLADILITPPAGADNYFMLSSEEAISNLGAFEQDGVMNRGREDKNAGPLESLLFTGTKQRTMVITPVTWAIQKTILRTSE